MERWQGRVAVVTGASAGIGAAIAADLVAGGMRVVGLARREDRLQELKKQLKNEPGSLHPLKADVTNEEDVKAAFKWVKENLGGVDVLVNNAGIFITTFVDEGDIDSWRKMFDVNVFALGSCTREALHSMKERNVSDGHIININSIASHRIGSIPGITPYSASKHASKAVTEGLRRELVAQKSNIKVTSISPGVVETEIFEAHSSFSNEKIQAIPHLNSKDIADAVHYVLATPPNVEVNELIIRPVGEEM